MNVMKKIYSFLMLAIISIVAVSSCQKMDGPTPDKNVLVGVSYEEVLNPDMTKVSINEGTDAFTLTWNADDVVTISNSANYTCKQNQALVAGANTSNATFSLELPAIDESITQVDYVLSSSSFSSRSYSEGNYSFLRGAVAASQSANGTNIANSCFIVGINKDCVVGDPGESFSMKTMNSFLKFELTNGDVVNYPNMYVSTIKIETVGGEQIAGRFGIDLTVDNWSSAYGNDTNINAADKSSFITLDCGNAELTDVAKTFYVAAAFGTYSKGLKVTISVNDGNGKYGEMVKTISNNTSLTLSRNVMYRYPAVAVKPTSIDVRTYNKVTEAPSDWTGTYLIVGVNSDRYYVPGTQKKNNLGHFEITSSVADGAASITGDLSNYEVTVAKVSDKHYSIRLSSSFPTGANQGYYLYAASSGDNYLRSSSTIADDNYHWSFVKEDDNTVTIKANGTYTRNLMQYNSGGSLFSCYSSASQKPVYLYKKDEKS